MASSKMVDVDGASFEEGDESASPPAPPPLAPAGAEELLRELGASAVGLLAFWMLSGDPTEGELDVFGS